MARIITCIPACFFACLWFSLSYSEAVPLSWPAGSYGIPRARVGCPLSIDSVWKTGWRFEDTEDSRPRNVKSPSFHLDATVDADINRTFCINNNTKSSAAEWPAGQYCIYKKGDCPKGFQQGSVFWDDENVKNINEKGGTLPDGIYNEDTLIYYCCRNDGDKFVPVPLPLISPFYLKAHNSSECQRVQGAIATEEFIRFDNEDDGNKDKQNGSHPYGAGKNNHNISYCYYDSCLYTYSLDNNETVKEFISLNFFGEGFPVAQKCVWRFVVPESEKTLHIAFNEVHLQGDDSIHIVDGWDGGVSLGIIDNKSPPRAKGYSPQGEVISLEFESKSRDRSRKRSKGFRGTFKVTKNEETGPRWPKGSYGLPRTVLGCPMSNAPVWKTGWRFQDTEDTNADNRKSESFHMDAVVMKNDMNRSFCIGTQKKGPEWPKGQYCIYKKGACPKGLTEGYIFFDDENHKNLNKMGGTLPDGVYNKDTKIFYCCRTDGDKLEPVPLPVMSPFYLMAFNTSECQRVKGALATKEYIRYDNEDTENKDSMNGTHPYEQGKANVTIMYCYYEACHFTISEKSQEFMSPNYLTDGYPNSQYCSWRFLIQNKTPPTEQILIKFPEFHLQKGNDGDKVSIYSGWDDTAPLLGEFNGDRPPPDKGVASNSPVVYVVFKSDSRGQSKGFRGLFLNQQYNKNAVPTHPITIPTQKTKPTTENANRTSTSTTTNETAGTATPTPAKQTGSESSPPIGIIVPVVIAIVIVVAMVSVYCIRRKRMERRIKRALGQSQSKLVSVTNDNYTYRDLDTHDSTEELQDIFPSS